MNVLVTGTSSYGVGEGLLKVVNSSIHREQIKLIGASNSYLTAFKDICDNYEILPNANSSEYISALLLLIEKYNVDILIPGSEAEVRELSTEVGEVILKSSKVLMNPWNVVSTFDSKLLSSHFFDQNSIPFPKTVKSIDENLKYPIFVKPEQGKSSENVFKISTRKQLDAILCYYDAYFIESIIQEYIEIEKEYTCSIVNSQTGVYTLITERILNKGATQECRIVDNNEIEMILTKVMNAIKEFQILNVQVAYSNGEYYVFEINPRFSGSAPMRALLGFNEFDLLISEKPIELNTHKDSYVIRGYSERKYLSETL